MKTGTYTLISRKSVPQIFAEIGLDREGVIATVAGRSPVRRIGRPPPGRSRPLCLICGLPISPTNCIPVQQTVAERLPVSGNAMVVPVEVKNENEIVAN